MRRKKSTREEKFRKLTLIIGLLIIASLACNMPFAASPAVQEDQPGFVETSIAETMSARENNQEDTSDQADTEDQDDQEQEDLPPSETPTPSATFTPSLTPTATYTPTPEMAMLYISENTNCRTGQGTSFPWLVSVKKGEEVEVVGVDTTGEYWYIRRPDQPTTYCWLWAKYATPSGPYQDLPAYTPMPTPTLGFDFTVSFDKRINCGWFWFIQYRVDNIGGFTIESWKTNITENSAGYATAPIEEDTFYDYSGCVEAGKQVDLEPGEAYYVNAAIGNDPDGVSVTTKIKLCTKNGLGGECLSKTIKHKPD